MSAKPLRLTAEPDREPRAQYAALPWRRGADGAVEVLLITSRETRRWVIPKGWPIKGMKSPKSAAREALEEAGVVGEVAKKPLGAFHYDKRLRSGRLQRVGVDVFALKVVEERQTWPEMNEREKLWTTPDQAADHVDEPELKAIFRRFRAE
ncbi:MAG: NUDIX hydrolase [Phenylobacterium sp.]|jgi:8-oxo-dGTP pyrophosphatase MutT (NUDIX family)|uniref:NUDIX hydrolase n=1 Tax=Phenylobacterium sp. TaxID=1871053 RepID=UPI00391B2A61